MAPKKEAPKAAPAPKPKAAAPKKDAAKKEPKKKKEEDVEVEEKIARPDKAEFDKTSREITEVIEKMQKELKELSGQISGKGAGKDEFFTQKAQIREKIGNESNALNALHARKDEISKSIKDTKDAGRAAMTDLKNMKKELKFESTEQIDIRIGHLEDKLMHESIPLKEEKKIMEEIKQLKKQKPKVSQMYLKEAQAKGSIEAAKSGTEGTKEELDALWAEINVHKAARDKLYEELKSLQEEREAQTGDVSGLYELRESLNAKIKAQIDKRNQLREDFKVTENKYYEYERSQRQARQEKATAERQEWADQKRKADRQRKVDNLDNQPFTHEISIIEQVTKFCKSYLPKEEKATEEKKETKHDNPETHMVLASKKDRDEEFYYAPTKVKAKAKAKAADDKKNTTIKHNAVTFKLFKELDLDAPITTSDVPVCLEQLEAKMKIYEGKIKEWETNREEMKRKIMAGEESDHEEAPAADAAAEAAGDAE